MKEAKAAREQQQLLLLDAAGRILHYQALLGPHITGGDEMMKKRYGPSDEWAFFEETERARVMEMTRELRVKTDGHKLHPVLLKHRSAFAAWKKTHPRDEFAPRSRGSYRRVTEGEPPLWGDVSEAVLPRVYLILDALFRAVEALGGSVHPDLTLQICGERVRYTITEGKTQTLHALTKEEQRIWEEYEKKKTLYRYAYAPRFRTYDYIPTGRLTFSARRDSYLRDSDSSGLESRLGEILLDLYREAKQVRLEREHREAAQRKAEEEKRQREQQRQRWNEEIDKLQALENQAADYARACRIRAYIAAVRAKPRLTEEEAEWVLWAGGKADWLDPTVGAEDPIFGLRDHSKSEEGKAPKKSSRNWG